MRKNNLLSVAISTVAIISGFSCKDTWEQACLDTIEALADTHGHTEIYRMIAENAVHSFELASSIEKHLPWLEHPGVYAYEVDEPFGVWLYEYCQQWKSMPSHEAATKKFVELALLFHSKGTTDAQQVELASHLNARTISAVDDAC